MYEVFEQLLKEKELKTADISRKTGIAPSVFSDWKKGRYELKGDKLKLVADALGVSVDYLMTGNSDVQRDLDTARTIASMYKTLPSEVDAVNKIVEFCGMSIRSDEDGNVVIYDSTIEKTISYDKYAKFCDTVVDYVKNSLDNFIDENLIELKIKVTDRNSINRLLSYHSKISNQKTEIPDHNK